MGFIDPYWQERFDERAGILEFDGGHPRAEAERLALIEITEAMSTFAVEFDDGI